MARDPARAGADWLALREPADASARSLDLVTTLRPHLPPDELVVHDLGSGTGSMARWLAPRLVGSQTWVLHDRDADLLERARTTAAPQSADGAPVRVLTRTDDVTSLAPQDLQDVDLLTASALLDMFTRTELDRFVAVVTRAARPALVTLSVVGRVELLPAEPLDLDVMAAFNAHQRRVTPDGPLLGPDAADVAAEAFSAQGLTVVRRPSPWRLDGTQAPLAVSWFDGWVGAACEQDPDLAERLGAYVERRRGGFEAGTAHAVVHHEDLLVLPTR